MDLNYNININQYYSLIDENILTNLCKNDILKYIIYLSALTNIYIFKQKNNKWYFKNKHSLLKECDKIKKKELKSSTNLLSNLAKLSDNININNFKNIYSTLENKIYNIDKFIDHINIINLDNEIKNNKFLLKSNNVNKKSDILKNTFNLVQNINDQLLDYIECYSNC